MLDRFDWERLEAETAGALARRLPAAMPHELDPAADLAVHRAVLPFYRRLRLYHCALRRADRPPATLMLLADDETSFVLDGSSRPVHAANEVESLRIEDDATAAAYLRFFCFVVRGEAGPFLIIEPPRERAIEAPAEPPLLPPVLDYAREIEPRGRDDAGRFLLQAVVGYGGGLFLADFAIAPDGGAEMLNDGPLGGDEAEFSIPEYAPLVTPEHLARRGPAPAAVPVRAVAAEAPALSPRRAPVGGVVLRSLVELLLEHALEVESGHRLLGHFNRDGQGEGSIERFARLVSTASPIVILRSSIPFVEESVAALLEQRLPAERRIPRLRPAVDVHDDTRLRPDIPAAGPSLVLFSFHAYRSVVDAERVSYDLSSRDVAALVGCESERDVPEPLRRIADLTLTLPPLTPALFRTLFTRVLGHALPPDWDEGGTHWVQHLLHSDFEQPHGLALDAKDALAFIRDRVLERLRTVESADGLPLEALHGLGEARTFARDLIADVHDALAGRIAWKDVDRGVLLAGPPGTGKTTLARAIARACGVKFVAASAAGWQAAGHLGDHIRALRADFALARRYAPAILFIDEIDSIGSRELFSGPHAQYHIEVVNALLEQMQGLDVEAPVVVIAATNYAERIDPALRRSGRLDRTIAIPYPNVEALTRMVEHHLARYREDGHADEDVDPAPIGALLFGLTGADVERVVRGAGRRARRAGRALVQRDLLEEVLDMPRDRADCGRLDAGEIAHIAAHEAGHAVAALLGSNGGRDLAFASIVPRADGSVGFVARMPTDRAMVTRAEMIERIEVVLAGRAAEEILFGEAGISTGSGGSSPASDLAVATRLALELVAQTGFGLDGSLVWSAEPAHRHHEQAGELLRQAYAAVRSRLEARRETLERVAEALRRTQELTGDELRVLAGTAPPTVAFLTSPPESP